MSTMANKNTLAFICRLPIEAMTAALRSAGGSSALLSVRFCAYSIADLRPLNFVSATN